MSSQTSSMRRQEEAPAKEKAEEQQEVISCDACGAKLEPKHVFCWSCSWASNENRAFDITDNELEQYLFNGFVERPFSFFNGKIRISLRTLQAGDYNEINRHMGQYAGGKRSIQSDYDNEQRLVTLSHAMTSWMGAEVPDVGQARELLEAVGESTLELIQDRFNRLVLGIQREVKKELRVKNS